MLGPWCLYCEKELVFGHESVTLTLAIHSVALSHKDLTRESVDVRLIRNVLKSSLRRTLGKCRTVSSGSCRRRNETMPRHSQDIGYCWRQ